MRMLILRSMHPVFQETVHSRKEINNNQFRCNRYVLTYEIPEGLLLWNTLSLGLVFIPNITVAAWKKKDLSRLEHDFMVRQYFYVPVSFDEDKIYNEIIHIHQKKTVLKTKYTILTTLYCNARCAYCYERHNRFIKTNMTAETAMTVVDFISRENKSDEIRLDWLGGEPLLNTRVIDIICKELTLKGVSFSSSLVTNGLLINDQILETALNTWKLKKIQITLDGREYLYNKTKNYSCGTANPYEVVMSNISKVVRSNIPLDIRLNLSGDNLKDLLCLVDELHQKYHGSQNILIYVSLLEEETHPDDKGKLDENKRNWQVISAKLWELGYRQKLLEDSWPIYKCIADNENCHVISPVGNLYRCEELSKEDIAGNIQDGITCPDVVHKWKMTNKSIKCLDCPINPVCYNLLHCPADLVCNDLTQFIDIVSRQKAMEYEYYHQNKEL